jgi:hypothetical protein
MWRESLSMQIIAGKEESKSKRITTFFVSNLAGMLT